MPKTPPLLPGLRPVVAAWRGGLGVAALCLIAIAVYWPGLAGDFLFDDWVNLPALGRYGGVSDWDGLLRYVTSGIADPTGRPISMLSFLVDARDWPAEPWPFKRTNLLLHACNGALLYGVLATLGRHIQLESRLARRAALIAAAAWLLHPLWASTVLYVVQRHAMLATFFVLLGLRAWIAARNAFARGEIGRGWFFAMLSVPACGLLAGLSKANGFLLPMLLLVLEFTVLQVDHSTGTATAGRHRRTAVMALLVVPAVLLLLALLVQAVDADVPRRSWTIVERLMTQPRVLFDYLWRLFVPGLDATGVFADGFPVSRGWWSPPTTLWATLALAALAASAWSLRRRWSVFSAAVLFFLAGHAMESGILPLEMYFEHRNYLPAALLFWPAALLLARPGRYLHWRLVFATGFVLICALATFMQARLWGDPPALARVWASQLPQSARAQVHAAWFDMAAGDYQRVITRLEPLLASSPGEVQYALTILEARCGDGTVNHDSLAAAIHAVRMQGVASDMVHQWLARTLHPDRRAICADLHDATLESLVDAAATRQEGGHPLPEKRSRIQRLHALAALRRRDCTAALTAFDRRIDIQRRPEFVQEQVALLATYCGPELALAHLDHYLVDRARGDHAPSSPMLRMRDRVIDRQGVWQREWRRLREVLEAERQAAPDQGRG